MGQARLVPIRSGKPHRYLLQVRNPDSEIWPSEVGVEWENRGKDLTYDAKLRRTNFTFAEPWTWAEVLARRVLSKDFPLALALLDQDFAAEVRFGAIDEQLQALAARTERQRYAYDPNTPERLMAAFAALEVPQGAAKTTKTLYRPPGGPWNRLALVVHFEEAFAGPALPNWLDALHAARRELQKGPWLVGPHADNADLVRCLMYEQLTKWVASCREGADHLTAREYLNTCFPDAAPGYSSSVVVGRHRALTGQDVLESTFSGLQLVTYRPYWRALADRVGSIVQSIQAVESRYAWGRHGHSPQYVGDPDPNTEEEHD